ncbi:MAG TPA: lysozyme [Chthoniobacterales bacterium]
MVAHINTSFQRTKGAAAAGRFVSGVAIGGRGESVNLPRFCFSGESTCVTPDRLHARPCTISRYALSLRRATLLLDHESGASSFMSNPRLGALKGFYPPPIQCVPKGSASLDVSPSGIAFLKRKEGFSGHLYNDKAGHCTIGYGHLVHLGQCDGSLAEAKFAKGITRPEAAKLASANLVKYVDAVRLAVNVELTQYEFDALVSFTYNLGANILHPKGHGPSSLLRHVNAGEWALITASFMKYVNVRNPETKKLEFSQSLANRRFEEARLFLFGTY